MELAPDLHVVLAPNAGILTGPGTNQYLVGPADDAVLIDVAALDDENARRLAASGCRPRRLLVTHAHPDHVGGACVLRARAGLGIAVHRRRAGFVFGGEALAPETLLDDGQEIAHGAGRLQVVYTPGHESAHCCFYDPDRRWLFSGDMILGTGTVMVAPPDGDMVAYLASLRRLGTMDLARILPGHGPPLERPQETVAEYLAHRLMREGQILEALAAHVTAVPAIVERLYADVPVVLHGAAAATVRAHLNKLVAEGLVVGEPDDQFRLS